MHEAGVVEIQPARRVLPARVKGEALDRFPVAQALQALQHHDYGHDQRRHRAPADIHEQVAEQLLWEQPEAFPMQQPIDRTVSDERAAEAGSRAEQVPLAGCDAQAHARVAPISDSPSTGVCCTTASMPVTTSNRSFDHDPPPNLTSHRPQLTPKNTTLLGSVDHHRHAPGPDETRADLARSTRWAIGGAEGGSACPGCSEAIGSDART